MAGLPVPLIGGEAVAARLVTLLERRPATSKMVRPRISMFPELDYRARLMRLAPFPIGASAPPKHRPSNVTLIVQAGVQSLIPRHRPLPNDGDTRTTLESQSVTA